MKIEMGESLFYSWLRHVKECQIVQTNWKVSSQWTLMHEEELQKLMDYSDQYFFERYDYRIFKKNRSLSQLLQQGECDVLGFSFQDNRQQDIYAVDVAFHEAGLNYGSHIDTVMRVVKKCLRTAMCIYGYFDAKDANIIFASPKINLGEINVLIPFANEVETILRQFGLNYTVRIIANDDFEKSVLAPILLLSHEVADTSELFMRSYQMYQIFSTKSTVPKKELKTTEVRKDDEVNGDKAYHELKIGKLANVVLRRLLEGEVASKEEIGYMQGEVYSKQFFGLNYPLLVHENAAYDKVRYYKDPLVIYGERYYLCSQWFETPANNDRPYLEKWIALHDGK